MPGARVAVCAGRLSRFAGPSIPREDAIVSIHPTGGADADWAQMLLRLSLWAERRGFKTEMIDDFQEGVEAGIDGATSAKGTTRSALRMGERRVPASCASRRSTRTPPGGCGASPAVEVTPDIEDEIGIQVVKDRDLE